MKQFCVIWIVLIKVVLGNEQYLQRKARVGLVEDPNNIVDSEDVLADTDIVTAFAVFRHGDRTPDQDEIDKFPADVDQSKDVFYPYGTKALTNKGKQRGFLVGEYLRRRYNGVISTLYVPDQISIRTTNFDRTKMTVLTALAAMFPPPAAQRWNPFLNWQPIPYDTPAVEDDDLLYYYNCPRYIQLRDSTLYYPETQQALQPYESVFKLLTEKTGKNITTPEDVFYLDNLFQAMDNVGVSPPSWAQEVMPQIKELTKIEYACEFRNSELIRLASGVLLADIVNVTNAMIKGDKEQPLLHLFSAHENNVAGLMAAIRVFKPHQPHYGATIILELRKKRQTGQYGFTAVYSPTAGAPGTILPIEGCGDPSFCDYDRFISLTQEHMLSFTEFKNQCTL